MLEKLTTNLHQVEIKNQGLKYREACVLDFCYDGNFEIVFHEKTKDIS